MKAEGRRDRPSAFGFRASFVIRHWSFVIPFCLHVGARPGTPERRRSAHAKGGDCLLYLLAILLPPVALVLCGKVVQALLCFLLLLTLLGWPLASLWALMVVADHHANQRADRLIRELRRDRAVNRQAALPATRPHQDP
jgi:uncharacterized membrane protein YqaE (UPF0057 family)